jgi:hypothetical protein
MATSNALFRCPELPTTLVPRSLQISTSLRSLFHSHDRCTMHVVIVAWATDTSSCWRAAALSLLTSPYELDSVFTLTAR